MDNFSGQFYELEDMSDMSGIPDFQDSPNVELFSISELRDIEDIASNVCLISEDEKRRCQVYEIELGKLGKVQVSRRQGISETRETNFGLFFLLEACDDHGEAVMLDVSPELIWALSGYWLTAELVEWSIENEEEIFDILYFALSDVCNYFGWSLRQIVRRDSSFHKTHLDCLQLIEGSGKCVLSAHGGVHSLNAAEEAVRRLSVAYYHNSLWLGRKVKFKLECHLQLARRHFVLEELMKLNEGDLLYLKQNWLASSDVQLFGHVICKGVGSTRWRRSVFVRMNDKEVRMEFESEDWQSEPEDGGLSESNGAAQGDQQGPDAVELDLVVGSTVLSFNDLCNIQEGSLVEIKDSLLPLVRLNIAGETILEGELVRLNQQLMVQVTKKVD